MKIVKNIIFAFVSLLVIGLFFGHQAKAATPSDEILNLHFDSNLLDSSGNNSLVTSNSTPKFVDSVNNKGIQISNEINSSSEKPGDDYYSISNNDKLNYETGNFSFGFWYQSKGGSEYGAAIVTNKDASSLKAPGFTIEQGADSIGMTFSAKDGGVRVLSSFFENDGRWHYLFFNVDRSTNMSAYVDGKKKGNISIKDDAGKYIGDNNLMIGAGINGLKALKDSQIDEFKFFQRALTDDEIADLSTEYEPPVTDELLAELHAKMKLMEDKINSLSLTESQLVFFVNTLEEAKRLENNAKTEADILKIIRKLDLALESLENPTDLDLMFNIFSDTHITTAGNMDFSQALDDIKYLSPESQMTLFNGDNNDDGSEAQYANFYNLLSKNNVVNPLLILGNHEARWQSNHEIYKERYLKWNSQYMGDAPSGQLYWSRMINGYHFIGLNTELDLKDNAYLSKDQLSWLKNELDKSKDDNKPVFIQLHQTFKGTGEHSILDTIYNEDQYPEDFPEKDFDCEEALKDVLKGYSNIVIFTGHIHNGTNLLKVYQKDYGSVVDLPSFSYAAYGSSSTSMAYQVQVKGTNIKLKLRDYKNNKWLPENEIQFNTMSNGG